MKRKYNAGACLLTALALLLICAGLWNTAGHDALQYVISAPSGEGEIARLVREKDDALSELKDALRSSAVIAASTGEFVSAPETGGSAQATLLAGSEGFFEVSPRYLVQGRLLSETELVRGNKKAVLDENLAFKLFPTKDPVGQTVHAAGTELEVVGVVRHARRVGEADLYSIYAPLLALQETRFEIAALTAVPLPGSGARIMFEDAAASLWADGGCFWDLEKEAVRAQLPLIYTLAIFAIALIVRLIGCTNRLAIRAIRNIQEKLVHEYAARLVPEIALVSLGLLLMYAALAGAMWLVGVWAVEPLYIFPEWVPGNFAQWSAIREVFWNLAVQDVRMTVVATGEVRALQFWAGVIQWGVMLLLTGTILLICGKRPLRSKQIEK